MTQREYREAIDHIVPDEGLKGRIAGQLNRRRNSRPARAGKRILATAVAAVAVAVCTMAAAMAVSPELRGMVLSFFHMEEVERVPELAVGSGELSVAGQSNIGEGVTATYIELGNRGMGYSYGRGVIYRRIDQPESDLLQTVQFWGVKEDELTELETRTTSFSVVWEGTVCEGTVFWTIWDGEVVCYGDGYGPLYEVDWGVQPILGRTDALLLRVSEGGQMAYREWPYLLSLESGAVEELLPDCGLEELGYAAVSEFSEDLRYALVTCYEDGELYFCDVERQTMVNICELTGLSEVEGAGFLDRDTLQVSAFDRDPEGGQITHVSCWNYDLFTGQMSSILEHVPYYTVMSPEGIMFFGSRYALRILGSGQTLVVDMKTGVETVVENFSLPESGDFLTSRAGTKLAYYVRGEELSGLGIVQLGVLDLEKGTFRAFDREGSEWLYEGSVGWFDDDQIIVNARNSEDQDRCYLILYQFS